MVKIMENPIKMDDLGEPLVTETSMYPENERFEHVFPIQTVPF